MRIEFDGNRYSVPPRLARQTITVRATRDEVRVLHQGVVVARHGRCYQRRQLIVLPDHRLAALVLRQRSRTTELELEFDALGPEARQFHLHLKSQPVKTGVHLRRLMGLARLLRDDGAAGHAIARPWSWRPTTRPMLRTSCWRNGGGENFPPPRYPLPGGGSFWT